ncbi:MAG: hypothetical protein WC807_10395 [Hyphomicrobium sp.]
MTGMIIKWTAALALSTAFTCSAEAGGGVRLGFGYPLGTFVATPSGGNSGTTTHDYKRGPRRQSPVVQASRSPRAEPKSDVIDSHSAKAAEVTKEAEVAKDASTTGKVDEVSTEPRSSATTVFSQKAATTTQVDAATEPQPPQAAKAVAATETATSAPAAAAATEPVLAQNPAQEPPKADAPKSGSDEAFGCKKFIPAVGLTISVRCGE